MRRPSVTLFAAAGGVNLSAIASACGYASTVSVDTLDRLDAELERVKRIPGPSFIEVKCALGARADLRRPTTSPQENKRAFMDSIGSV